MLTVHFLFTQNHIFKGVREPNSAAICDLWEFLAFSLFRHPSLTDGAQSHSAIHNSSLYHKFLVPPPPPNACLTVARTLLQQCWHELIKCKTFLHIGSRKAVFQFLVFLVQRSGSTDDIKNNKYLPGSKNDSIYKFTRSSCSSSEIWSGEFCHCLPVSWNLLD